MNNYNWRQTIERNFSIIRRSTSALDIFSFQLTVYKRQLCWCVFISIEKLLNSLSQYKTESQASNMNYQQFREKNKLKQNLNKMTKLQWTTLFSVVVTVAFFIESWVEPIVLNKMIFLMHYSFCNVIILYIFS